jgi:hypothetical protein
MLRPRPHRPHGEGAERDDVGCWFRSSDDVRTGFARGNKFDLKRVRYAVVDDLAIFEGDIVLGTVEQVERDSLAVADPASLPLDGVAITGDRYRWPGGVIPYTIDSSLLDPTAVEDAIAHWTARTNIRFVPRRPEDLGHRNYVSFESLSGCWSEVGMRGGKQTVSLGSGCGLGSAIHEIGHVVGLWHEQSRSDRNEHVDILWENILEGREHNFNQQVTDGDDIGAYDFGSIMHYPMLAFSKNNLPTIVPRHGEAIGQRTGLSALDVAAVRAMYPQDPAPTTPTNPTAPIEGRSGSQILGAVSALDSRRWITGDWPLDWNVVWNIIPSPESARVEWKVVTERQSETLLRYYIEVRNLSPIEAQVEIRYLAL